MSNHYQRTLSLTGLDVSRLSIDDLRDLVRQILNNKIHGLSFSPYIAGQGPGTQLEEKQICERLDIIQPYVRWIRSFSCSEGNQLIPKLGHDRGLKTLVGVWLDDNVEQNEIEIRNAVELANAGHADILAVGNEVLLRGDLTENELIDYIRRVRAEVPADLPVGYVDAYFEFVDHPRITEACDVLLANCYPFWEGCAAEYALLYMKDMYRRVEEIAGGKRIVISETGWPNIGTATGASEPSFENAIKYFVDTCQWSEQDGIEFFYFSSFDEAWKVDAEGDVGAYWGLWDADGHPKYV